MTHPAFFAGEIYVGGAYYLKFPDNGNRYSAITIISSFPILYHYDLGFEYFVDANDGQAGAYFYDFTSGNWFYSNPCLFPYLLRLHIPNTWLFYFTDPKNPGHYTANPRYFANLGTGLIFTM